MSLSRSRASAKWRAKKDRTGCQQETEQVSTAMCTPSTSLDVLSTCVYWSHLDMPIHEQQVVNASQRVSQT